MQETWVQSLVQEDPTCLEPGLLNKRRHHTTTREPWEPFLKVLIDFVTILLLVLFLFFFKFWFFGPKACVILATLPGIKLVFPALEGRVLTPGLPRKLLEGLSLGNKESSEKASPCFAISQMLTIQNNQFIKAFILGWRILLPFIVVINVVIFSFLCLS